MSAEDDSAMDIDEESSSKLMNGGELTIPDAPSEEVNEDPKYGQKDTVNEKKDEDGSGNGSVGKLKSDSTSVPSTVPSTADPSLINGSINGIAPSATNNINGTVSTSQQNGGTGTGTGTGSSGVHTPSKTSGNKRIDVDNIMSDFQKALGDNWDRYREVITQFLIGKLTRGELQEELDHVLDKNTIHMHNHFLLANLANAFRDPPPGERGMLNGWSKRQKDPSRNVKGDSQLTKLKEDIMGLSVRERKRIKAIARESGKRAPIPSTITATRQAMLPKIPFVNDKEKLNNQQPKTPNAPIATPIPSQQGSMWKKKNNVLFLFLFYYFYFISF